ncbi:MAG: 3-oxoacyl-ACP synthase, partial [Candidatus Wallbacteria bacterium]|nr:3-oxoacyl-ACP synthase [Candidatus Wallbacteria bacterium]
MNKIIGTGSYLPERIVSNEELERTVDLSGYVGKNGEKYAQWVERVMGFKFRHVADDKTTTSDMALHASNKALTNAAISADDLDLIIVVTSTPDKKTPNTASILQSKLGQIEKSWAFDINAACPGFIYGMSVADALMKANPAIRYTLVAASEKMSSIIDRSNFITSPTFGDGAGAVIMAPSGDQSGIIEYYARSNGRMGELLDIPAGGSLLPITPENCRFIYDKKLNCLTVKTGELKCFASEKIVESVKYVCRKHFNEP